MLVYTGFPIDFYVVAFREPQIIMGIILGKNSGKPHLHTAPPHKLMSYGT